MALELAAERRLFTRAEYHRMGEVGILGEDEHVTVPLRSPQGPVG